MAHSVLEGVNFADKSRAYVLTEFYSKLMTVGAAAKSCVANEYEQ